MKRYKDIRNLEDLQARKLELKVEYTLKQNMLKSDTKTYFKQFTLGALIKRYATPNNLFKADEKLNISGTAMSLLLPMVIRSSTKTAFNILSTPTTNGMPWCAPLSSKKRKVAT